MGSTHLGKGLAYAAHPRSESAAKKRRLSISEQIPSNSPGSLLECSEVMDLGSTSSDSGCIPPFAALVLSRSSPSEHDRDTQKSSADASSTGSRRSEHGSKTSSHNLTLQERLLESYSLPVASWRGSHDILLTTPAPRRPRAGVKYPSPVHVQELLDAQEGAVLWPPFGNYLVSWSPSRWLCLSGFTESDDKGHTRDFAELVRNIQATDETHELDDDSSIFESVQCQSMRRAFAYPDCILHHDSQLVDLTRLKSLIKSACKYLKEFWCEIEVPTKEIAFSICHRVVFSKSFSPWKLSKHGDIVGDPDLENEKPWCYLIGCSRLVAACCLSIAIKYGQHCRPPMDDLWKWVHVSWRQPTSSYSPESRKCAVEGMELAILAEIDWRPMPHPTIYGMLFSTGLLEGLAPRCLEVLEQIILASYDEISLRDRHKVVLYQVRVIDPGIVALACYRSMINICCEEAPDTCLKEIITSMKLQMPVGECAELDMIEDSLGNACLKSMDRAAVLAMAQRIRDLYVSEGGGKCMWWWWECDDAGNGTPRDVGTNSCARVIDGFYFRVVLTVLADILEDTST